MGLDACGSLNLVGEESGSYAADVDPGPREVVGVEMRRFDDLVEIPGEQGRDVYAVKPT